MRRIMLRFDTIDKVVKMPGVEVLTISACWKLFDMLSTIEYAPVADHRGGRAGVRYRYDDWLASWQRLSVRKSVRRRPRSGCLPR